MDNTIQEYATNFSAIMASNRIPLHQKKTLLKNIVKDMRFTYLEEFKKRENTEYSQMKKEVLGYISCFEKKIKRLDWTK